MNAKNTELMNKIKARLEEKGYECSKEAMMSFIFEWYLEQINRPAGAGPGA